MQHATDKTFQFSKVPPKKGLKIKTDKLSMEGLCVKCNSEDGFLKLALVHSPLYLNWTRETAINGLEQKNLPPPKDKVLKEHWALVKHLMDHGTDVIELDSNEKIPEGVYQRDSVGVIGDIAFTAKFRYPVRQIETTLLTGVLSPWNEDETMEFGDVLVFPDAVLVGIGDRTNHSAVKMLEGLITTKEVVAIPLHEGTLHLDYTLGIGGHGSKKTMIACPNRFKHPSIMPWLIKRFDVRNTIIVKEENYMEGWTNVLFLDPETVITTASAVSVNDKLKEIGFNVIDISFDGILTGEGAPRCCVAPLCRED